MDEKDKELFKKRRRISISKAESISLVLGNDILMEILTRVPDSRSIIRCSAVCKQWWSLINSPHYKELKQSSSFNLPTHTFIFTLNEGRQPDDPICDRFYGYFPENSKLLHGISSSWLSDHNYLSFSPWKNARIISSFRDLLLLTPDDTFVDDTLVRVPGVRRLAFCNPLTKQLPLLLPLLPRSIPYRVECGGLVLYENRQQNHQYKYKVMIIYSDDTHFDEEFTVYWAATLCSETRNWSLSNFRFPLPRVLNSNVSVACNGMLHCLEEHLESGLVYRAVAFDPFKDSNHPKYCRFINFPSDLGQGQKEICNPVTVRLGAVRGQLRLSQLLLISGRSVLKVWELNYNKEQDDDDGNGNGNGNGYPWSWTLVYDVEVRSIYKLTTTKTMLFVVAFHPEDGGVIFLSRGFRGQIYRYDIGKGKMKLVGKLPNDGNEIEPIGLRAYTLTHPIWPTVLPSSFRNLII